MSSDGKFGKGFDERDLISPIHVGPELHGMEGWTPMNPEISEPHDPLSYIPKEHSKKEDRY